MSLKVSPSEDNKEQEHVSQAIWRGGDMGKKWENDESTSSYSQQ